MVQDAAAAAVDDKSYFRELEAIYLLRLLLANCGATLESCAYEMQDASAVLTAKLQRKCKAWVAVTSDFDASYAKV